ncbi:acylaminoacyl-peptidase [Tieghemostelium lacteum]|uniref:acylaminoacyl-peptidase n=1 Tax=Tieghemostelium lacteum TaxID=361077 RepID=A0A151ZE09_TIELA|nr:acylaminoacyl-peptidase [Tieghemostelium lacteum]|eukprot:KYQ92193.1 acylaminoacyl-peptidase [Tieghemostelium lacteum]
MSTSDNIDFRTQAISKYKEIISIPTVDSAYFVDRNSISVILSQTDITNKKNKYYHAHRSWTGDNVNSTKFSYELASNMVYVSPSKERVLTIKEISNDGLDSWNYTFDVQDSQHLITSIQVKDIHRMICTDEWFGRLVWSPCEKFVAYVADAKSSSTSFYDKDPKDKVVGDQYILREDWGETYVSVTSPSIFILDIEKEQSVALDPFPSSDISAGQLTWTPDSSGLVFAGWDVKFRKLGIRACYNRLSSLYYVNVKEYLKELDAIKKELATNAQAKKKPTSIGLVNLLGSVRFGYFRSPRFTPDGKELLFLGFDQRVLPHNSCSKIFKLKWNNGRPVETYEVILDEKNFKDQFKGVYCVSLPTNPFLTADTILFSTNIKSVQSIISLNINTKNIQILNNTSTGMSFNLLDIDASNRQLIVAQSNLNQPPQLVIVSIKDTTQPLTISNDNSNVSLLNVYENSKNSLFGSYQVSLYDVPVQDTDSPGIDSFEIVYLKLKDKKSNPLLIYPHGGPNSAFTTEYSFALAFLISQGYNIALVNFRGSTGFGKDFVECLAGKIGRVDVKDSLDTIDYLVKLDPQGINTQKVSVIGGSHSGFLAAHMSIDPRIRVSVMRNPVIDIASMSTQSDIPDWCFYQCGIMPDTSDQLYYQTLPTIKQLQIMRDCSPIANIDKVKIPTLILLGNCDIRVPFSQGLLYHRSLKERNVTNKCLIYPKAGHSLDTIECKLDQWIHIACWLEKHLSK